MKKKIMFILCTIVILCMSGVVMAATELKDVKNTKYEDSVNTLITLGVVNGYPEDNTYRPNNAVTRAEMAKLMVVALGEEDKVAAAKKATSKFKDVKSTDWEVGYVNVAANLGIINGYPDGTFGSKNTVSYAEATAMIIRALQFEDEVKKSQELWPNNYINQAKKLSLYNSVGTVNSNEGAKRGNVAILLWNMLRTGVCTVVGQNNNGLVYGEGTKLINQTMPNFVYIEEALIDDVTFDDTYEMAELVVKGDKTIKPVIDALDAAEMYGRKFNILYNKSSKKIIQANEIDGYTVKEGNVENVTSTKIYLENGLKGGYKLPDNKNILLYGIDDIDDAVTATLMLSGSTVKYIVAYAPEDVNLALVTATEVTVSKKDGIKILNYKSSSAKSYALKDESKMPEVDDVILYYLTDKDEVVILDKSSVFTSTEVDTANSTKIVAGKYTYKLSDTDYTIAKIKTNSITSMSSSSIEEDVDSVDLISFGGYRYYIVYIGGVDKAIEELKKDIKTACDSLTSYMNSVKSTYTNQEKTYTLATFTKFANAYDAATSAKATAQATASTTNLNKVKTAHNDLKAAYTALKKISDLPAADREDETSLIEAKIALRKIVKGETPVNGKKVTTCVANKSTYTTASYATFETALNNANSVLKSTSATANKIETATFNLKEAMDGLLTQTEGAGRETALTALNAKIKEAEDMQKNASSYVEEAYNTFVIILEKDAKVVAKDATATETEIKAATERLEDAIIMLSGNLKESSLNNLMQVAREKLENKEIYMTSAVTALETAYASGDTAKDSDDYAKMAKAATDLQKAIDNLENNIIDEILKALLETAKGYKATSVTSVVGSMTKDNLKNYSYPEKESKIAMLKQAINVEQSLINSWRTTLTAQLNFANTIKAEDWNTLVYAGDYDTFDTARKNADDKNKNPESTSEELKTAYEALVETMKTK